MNTNLTKGEKMRMFSRLMLICTAVFAALPAFAQEAAHASGGMDLKALGATLGVGLRHWAELLAKAELVRRRLKGFQETQRHKKRWALTLS